MAGTAPSKMVTCVAGIRMMIIAENAALSMNAAMAGSGRPSIIRKITPAAPATSTTDDISAAMTPTMLAKLRYDSSALPSSPRMYAVSPAGMPLMNWKRDRSSAPDGFGGAGAGAGEDAGAGGRSGIGSVGGSSIATVPPSSSATPLFFLIRRARAARSAGWKD